ncbi:MAG: hypothetical protein AAGB34_08300 [Planctomycetota bacterium]
MNQTSSSAIPLLVLSLLAAPAIAENDPGILTGPPVEDTSTTESSDQMQRQTIVHRNFDGSLERIKGSPELAAIDQLHLSDEERLDVDNVLNERAAIIDSMVLENFNTLDDLRKLRNSETSARERMDVYKAFAETFRPLIDRGTMRDEVASVLSEDQREAFTGMLDEYHEAVRKDQAEQRIRRDNPDSMQRIEESSEQTERRRRWEERRNARLKEQLGVNSREDLLSFTQEAGASLQRVIESARDRLDAFLEAIDATPEQTAEITRLAQNLQRNNDAESRQKYRQAVREIFQMLDTEQRRKLIDWMRNR